MMLVNLYIPILYIKWEIFLKIYINQYISNQSQINNEFFFLMIIININLLI